MRRRLLFTVACLLVAVAAVAADEVGAPTAEDRVRELYGLISVEPGGPLPDWAKIRSFFLDEAVIFMRTSRESSETFTLDQWVSDFQAFIGRANVAERGFTERIVRLHMTEFRDVAQVMVLYKASFPTSTTPPQLGVDMVHLARIEGEWRIVSIVNDIPESTDQIPGILAR